MMARRVVVTGLGICCPLGIGVPLVWRRLLDGVSGITRVRDDPEFDQLPSKVAGFVPRGSGSGEFQESNWVSPPQRRRMSLASVYALCASDEALRDARWWPKEEDDQRKSGVAIGSGHPSMSEIAKVIKYMSRKEYHKISPYIVTICLANLPCGEVSIRFGLLGPNHTVSTACATGTHAVGDASTMIRRGICDVVVAGSTDACIDPITMAALCRAKALSTKFNATPELASRPFDSRRNGFVISEGAGVTILEELDHAKARGANIYAEILGYGMSGDGYHITMPSSVGTIRSMQLALNDAGLPLDAVGHINAHATSTPIGDASENKAVKTLFKEHAYKLLISAPKSSVGHLLAASGSVEVIFSILAVKHGIVPPTRNLENLSAEFDLNYVPGTAEKWRAFDTRVVVTNSFGFGGTNASLCIGEYVP